MKKFIAVALLEAALLAACWSAPLSRDRKGAPNPPIAAQKPHIVRSANGDRPDPYYWLRDDTRSNPEVLAHLAAETRYAEAMLAHTKPAQELLYAEMLARTPQDEASVPQFERGYWYYARHLEGSEYAIHARKRETLAAPEEILLDGNALARGRAFFEIGAYHVSPDDRRIAWVEDTVGRQQWTLRVKELATGSELSDRIVNIEAEFVWADGETLLYIEKDPLTLLGQKVRKHRLGTDPANDSLVHEEKDPAFFISLERSPSGRLLWIALTSTRATELRYAAANDPALAFHTLIPRERDHLYDAADFGNEFVIRTNWHAKNFRIVRASASEAADRSRWREVVAQDPEALIEDFFVFDEALAIGERSRGLRSIRVRRWADGQESLIAADEPAYAMSLDDNRDPGAKALRYAYTSLTSPISIYDYELATGERVLRKRQAVLGAFDPEHYRSELLWVAARDGARVPVSLVHRRGFRRDGRAPLLLSGYGAYGLSTDAEFEPNRLSLLDRGFVFAIAHVRGGQELGRAWYEDGRLLRKQNSFNDFVDVTRELVARGYAAQERVFATGGSAGGLLMGAVLNQCPECYRGALVRVPFVDAVTTMLDESIPLTTNEFDEWGDPKQKAYYDYMLAYSPYDNIPAKRYPALLVTTGLWDGLVQYYEPAKWVAKLRAKRKGNRPLLLHVNMEAGHSGRSGRFQRLRETAMNYAFLLDQAGVPVTAPAAATVGRESPAQLRLLEKLRHRRERYSYADFPKVAVTGLAGLTKAEVRAALGAPSLCYRPSDCDRATRWWISFYAQLEGVGGGPELVLYFDSRGVCTQAEWAMSQ